MTPSPAECPTIQEWESLALGSCEPSVAAALNRHVASCAQCTQVLAAVHLNLGLASAVRSALEEKSTSHRVSPATTGPLGLLGRQFDGYTILRVLGSGASATVYEAHQEKTGSSIAIKVLSAFAMGDEHLRRFEHEAKILARLHHPGIARVYSTGIVADDAASRPYIAMELVDGLPITQHAAEQQLSTAALIALLIQACEAVEYAHSCSVIHRDLKPANVLVTRGGSVRVVDFGFARLTGPQSLLSTMHTAQGHIVGTVAYMSPEHVIGANAVDARSDVYSLGVIGYELLAGRAPYLISDISIELALRTITDTEPVRPSRVNGGLSGDIEVVLLHALSKRPQDRYASAGAFAADLRRVLTAEPILAHRPGVIEQAGRFARTHRALVAGFLAVFAATLLGLAGTTYGLLRAMDRTRLAEDRQKSAEQLASLLEKMLREAHPHETKGKSYTVHQMLDDFSRRFAGGLSDQPLVEASLRTTMGSGYRVLGEYAKARPHLERALELRRFAPSPSPSHIASALCELGMLEHDEGKYSKAIEAFREAVNLGAAGSANHARALLGWSDCLRHSGDLKAALERGKAALDSARAITKPPIIDHSADLSVAEARISLSRVERELGDYDASQKDLDAAMETFKSVLGPDDPRLADALNDRAWLALMRRDYAAAEKTAREAIDVGSRTLGENHPDLGNSKYELGLILASRNKAAEGEMLLRESLAIYVAAHGEIHPSTFTAQEALARILRNENKYQEAQDLLERVVNNRREFFGARNIEVGYGLASLALVQKDLKDYTAAEASILEAIDIYQETYKGPHSFIASAQVTLAQLYQARGDFDAARRVFEESLATSEAAVGPNHADTLTSIATLAWFLESQSQWQVALARYDQIIERCTPTSPRARCALAQQGRGRCLLALGRIPESVESHRTALASLEAIPDPTSMLTERIALAREQLEKALTAAGDTAGAAAIRAAAAGLPQGEGSKSK